MTPRLLLVIGRGPVLAVSVLVTKRQLHHNRRERARALGEG